MSHFQSVSLKIHNSNDKHIYKKLVKICAIIQFEFSEISFSIPSGTTFKFDNLQKAEDDTVFQDVLEENQEIITGFYSKFKHIYPTEEGTNNPQGESVLSLNISISRKPEELFNEFRLSFSLSPSSSSAVSWKSINEAGFTKEDTARIITFVSKEFTIFNSQKERELFLGDVIGRHYEIREAELSRMEKMLENLSNNFENVVLEKQNAIESHNDKRRARLEAEYEKRQRELDEREKELEERIKKVDNNDSKHARRQLRQDMKKELTKRATSFALTEGTRKLRNPIWGIAGALLVLFGFGVGFYAWEGFKAFDKGITDSFLLSLIAKQVFMALGFGSTAIFLIKWHDAWFQQHAREEFRLKRLELDFDRASWVVETALEWKDEKGSDIPPELIKTLTQNLFTEQNAPVEKHHPMDHLASLLLGSAASTKLKIGESEITLDRESVKKIEKEGKKQEKSAGGEKKKDSI